MPLYQYRAVSEKGKKILGAIDAESLEDAKMKLIRRQIAVFHIENLKKKDRNIRLKPEELLYLTQELARLLFAGLPLYEALLALEEKYRSQKAHKLLLSLCDQVRSGASFSKTLASHPETFDLLYVSMVANSEKTGTLVEALDELAKLLSKQKQVRKQLISALSYPALLAAFCGVILLSLLFYVIPSLRELFEGRELHPLTSFVLKMSHFACEAKPFLITFVILCIGFFGFSCFSQKMRRQVTSLTFKVPGIKNFLAKVAFIRFFRAAATLLEGSLPIIQAFDQARRVMKHPELEKLFSEAQEKILEGKKIHQVLMNHPLVPPLIPRMISIAEEGGRLPFMMLQIAEIYEEEVEKSLAKFTSLIQPLLLLGLGVVIGFVLLSVLLPMTDVGSFIGE